MKKLYILILFISFCSLSQNVSAQDFEGIIKQRQITAEGITYDMNWYISKEKLAYELHIQSPEGYIDVKLIPNITTNTLKIVTKTTNGNYIKNIPISEIKTSKSIQRSTLNLLSENNNIQEYVVNGLSTNGTIKVNKAINFDFSKYAPFFKENVILYAFLRQNIKGFPEEIIEKDASGNIVQKIELISINRQKIDESYFK